MSSVDIFTVAFIAIMVLAEWRYRAKRDGKQKATNAILFAAIFLGVGLNLQKYFGMAGLMIMLPVLIAITTIIAILRFKKT